jgi:hypothetical protein
MEMETDPADILSSSVPTKGAKKPSDLSADAAGQKRKRRTRADIKVTSPQRIQVT